MGGIKIPSFDHYQTLDLLCLVVEKFHILYAFKKQRNIFKKTKEARQC